MHEKKLKVGDSVRVLKSTHISKIASISGRMYELEQKAPHHRFNAYYAYELELIEAKKEELANG